MIPTPSKDDTLDFIAKGYDFGKGVWERARSLGSPKVAPMKLLGTDSVLVRGEEGIKLYYNEELIDRQGAMPGLIGEPLFGHGSVHSMDGEAHRRRKNTFVQAAYVDEQVERLTPYFEREWTRERDEWIAGGTRSAYDAAVGALGRGIQRWAGLPGTADAKTRFAARLAQIVDGFGAVVEPAYVVAWANRKWCDQHAAELIEAVRAGTLEAREGTALHAWAWHRELDGELLDARLAGIELQNILRPTIAVARFVAFAAKELEARPEWRARIAQESAERGGALVGGPLAVAFAQEVRRTAPFVPMLPGLAKRDIEFAGETIPAGTRVFIDIQGTNHDPAVWDDAEAFSPERFLGHEDYEALTSFVPQGGGEVPTGHRCPGEKVAIAGLSAAITAMSDPRLAILPEGLEVNRRRFPTKPSSGGRLRSIAKQAGAGCPVEH